MKLTQAQRDLLEQLDTPGVRIVHSQDGDCAWLSPRRHFGPHWNDLDWGDMAALRRAGFIADLDDGEEDSRFVAPEVITPAGRAALSEATDQREQTDEA